LSVRRGEDGSRSRRFDTVIELRVREKDEHLVDRYNDQPKPAWGDDLRP
jgi:hypothetical protein